MHTARTYTHTIALQIGECVGRSEGRTVKVKIIVMNEIYDILGEYCAQRLIEFILREKVSSVNNVAQHVEWFLLKKLRVALFFVVIRILMMNFDR